MNLLDRVVKGFTEREIRKLFKEVSRIEAFELDMQKLSDVELSAKTEEFRARLAKGETLDQLLPEAFAVVREAAVRVIGQRPFPVQLLGGIVLHQGRIAEMKTGEGKTLTATAPAYLNALSGKGVHVITVNDYLARFQKDWMSKVYNFLGLSVGCILHGMSSEQRRAAYNCDITYGTNNEFGFDYLRDNMVVFADQQVQRQLNYAIVDEVDSILIDEARTPLIISGEGEKSTDLYRVADIFAQGLKVEVDFLVDEKQKSVVLTDENGTVKAERFFQIENLSDPENMEISHHINQALKAHYMMKRDVDYVVKEGEIMIVDEHTGRLMEGRRYSNGLHQAIEAKEELEVRRESQTLATITLQNYFRMFNKLSGMTGTAKTEEDELQHIYNLDVVAIPTNKPIQRTDIADIIYRTMDGKFKAVIADIVERHKLGQPMLVGTVSIETSEYLSSLLKKKGIQHEVLNAKQHEREAEIVAQAGRKNAVTIATNMAGRGTDILLGGNPEFMSKREMLKLGFTEQMISYVLSPLHYEEEEIIAAKEIYQEIYNKFKSTTDAEAREVCEVGGLHIMGTERHESRRIDNQLRGRAGRQGDPGSSQFFLSFDDDLMRLFVNDSVKAMVDRLGMDDETPLEASLLSKSIENAQKKVEGRNFAVRKHVLQYDDVMNKQRSIIYAERAKVLHGEDLKDHMLGMVDNVIDASVTLYTANSDFPEEWDLKEMEEHFHQIFMPRGWLEPTIKTVDERLQLGEKIKALAYELYEQKEAEFESERMRDLERFILLRVVDQKWMDHIDDMDQLKQGINLRAYAQEDPVRAYQKEGFSMFEDMIYSIQEEALKYIFHAAIQIDTTRTQVAKVTSESGGGDYSGPVEPVRSDEEKVGRNDPCPCGSGKKYKKCCGANL